MSDNGTTRRRRDALLARGDVLPTDTDDDGLTERRRVEAELEGRLALVFEHSEASRHDVVARLLEPIHVCLGEPCAPFVPGIHREAAATIEALEDGTAAPEAVANVALRLVGIYGIGPGGIPEFGYRLYPATDIQMEARGRICSLSPDAAAALGVGRRPAPGPRP
jgi:hypothetical protein